MGIKNVSAGGFQNQNRVRQGLMGVVWVVVAEYEIKPTVGGKMYVNGKCVVNGAGENYTYFQFWPTEKNSMEDFKLRYPEGAGAYWLVTVSQNSKEVEKENKKVTNTFTSMTVIGFKDDYNESMDGLMSGVLKLDVENSKYREAGDGKEPWILLKANADTSYTNRDGDFIPKVQNFEIQGFGKVADSGFDVLKEDDVVDGTAVHVRAAISGSRLNLVSVSLSKASPEALSGANDKPEVKPSPSVDSTKVAAKSPSKKQPDVKSPWL